jgi:hypothetical protein
MQKMRAASAERSIGGEREERIAPRTDVKRPRAEREKMHDK